MYPDLQDKHETELLTKLQFKQVEGHNKQTLSF